mgnify:CR=1 FL=1
MTALYDFLIALGFDVYFVGQKTSDCTSNYVVIRDGITSAQYDSFNVGYTLVDIILYVPRNANSQMLPFKQQIKDALKAYKPLKYAGIETGTVSDDSVKGLTSSITYMWLKPLI